MPIRPLRETNHGYTIFRGRRGKTIRLDTLDHYSQVVTRAGVGFGARVVVGYGSMFVHDGSTPLHTVLVENRDGTSSIDKLADQMWVVPSMWHFTQSLGHQLGWSATRTSLFYFVHGVLSMGGLMPRYVSFEIDPPPASKFVAVTAAGKEVDITVPVKVGIWTEYGLAFNTARRVRSNRWLGQWELSLPLRLTKAGVTQLYAASTKDAAVFNKATQDMRLNALQIVWAQLESRPPNTDLKPHTMEKILTSVYGISYDAEGFRREEGKTKVPALFAADRSRLRAAYLGPVKSFARSYGHAAIKNDAGVYQMIEADQITEENFWNVVFFKMEDDKTKAPNPTGMLCRLSYYFGTMLGNSLMSINVTGVEGSLAYGRRKIRNNDAIVFQTKEPIQLTGFIMGRLRIPFTRLEIPFPFGRWSVLWILVQWGRKKLGPRPSV